MPSKSGGSSTGTPINKVDLSMLGGFIKVPAPDYLSHRCLWDELPVFSFRTGGREDENLSYLVGENTQHTLFIYIL